MLHEWTLWYKAIFKKIEIILRGTLFSFLLFLSSQSILLYVDLSLLFLLLILQVRPVINTSSYSISNMSFLILCHILLPYHFNFFHEVFPAFTAFSAIIYTFTLVVLFANFIFLIKLKYCPFLPFAPNWHQPLSFLIWNTSSICHSL